VPDLATHLLAQTTINQLPWIRKIAPFTLLGATAPDLVKGFSRWATPAEKWWVYPFHSPLFMAILFYAVSLLFHEKDRPYVFAGGIIGVSIHVGLDLLQIHLIGEYFIFFPFSFQTVSFGLFPPEATLIWLPVTIAVTAAAIIIRKLIVKRA